MKSQPTFLFLTYFSRIEMAISSKERKAYKFGLLSNFVECESSLNQTLLTFLLCLKQTWMAQLILAISL